MTEQEFFRQLPVQLNAQQREAVRTIDGPVLLLAVPGSGKTTVLVSRLGYMIYCCGIAPERILTVTYTVAATRDMSRRFDNLFHEESASHPEFRTINGICAKIIAFYGRQTGREAFRLVTDEKQTAAILSQIYQRIEEDYPTENDLKTVRTAITYIKNMMLGPEEIEKLEEKSDYQISVIYSEYCKILKEQKMMDYDDQMVYAYTILRRIPQVLAYFQSLYPYICVDEAQDTSRIQHAIIALLASGNDNLFMVGDEDQSIYGFRAAYPEALLDFESNHKGAKVLLMEENFRSNAKIVSAADQFIQKNTLRHDKRMNPTRKAASDIRLVELKGRRAQYQYLAKVAENCQRETAVLYRDNESSIPIVDLLERNQIPYRIRNAELTYFSHRIVSDIEDIMRFALNPTDTQLFLKIYFKIGTFIKKVDAVKIAGISETYNVPVLDAAIESGRLPLQTVSSIRNLRKNLRAMLEDSADRAITRIVNDMGYGNYLERSGMSSNKLFVLKTIAARESSIGNFLQRMAYLEDIFKTKEPDYDAKFILSTIHASKGLEYDAVYLIDIADSLFPEKAVKDVKKAPKDVLETYEEERRLFYVGVTRAKNELNVFSIGMESIFLTQLLGRLVGKEQPARAELQTKKAAFSTLSSPAAKKERISTEQLRGFSAHFKKGTKVRHKKFGPGNVTVNDGRFVSILFRDGSERKFSLETLYSNQLIAVAGE